MALILDRIGRVRAATRNPLTLIGRDICASHVTKVWDHILKCIHEELKKGFGFRIPGLVTFGIRILKNVYNPQMIAVEKSIQMIMSQDLAKMHGIRLKRQNDFITRVTTLNVAKLTLELNLPRNAVMTCIAEVVHAFRLAVEKYKKVHFVFEGIGSLIVQNQFVHTRFEPAFMEAYGFGIRILDFTSKFPYTCEREQCCVPMNVIRAVCYNNDDADDECGNNGEN